VVVTDDRIETIIDAIIEGRTMWSSVTDALGILLGGNLGEIAFTVGSTLLTGRSALNARQLLLVNLLTDMLPAMMIAVRPPPAAASAGKLLADGPEASLGATLTRDIYARGVMTGTAAALAWIIARVTGTRARADNVGLISLVSAQLLQTLMAGSRDKAIVGAVLGSLAALALAVSVPGVSGLFGGRPVGPIGWLIGLGSAGVVQLGAQLAGQLTSSSSAVH
jgi:cation-transporting ATPase I